MPQLPTFCIVTVLPEMLQLPFGTTTKETGKPELAVALTVIEVPTRCDAIALKVIVCDCWAAATLKLCVTDWAAAYTVFPACEAVMVQVPAAIKDAVLPDTVQTAGVDDA